MWYRRLHHGFTYVSSALWICNRKVEENLLEIIPFTGEDKVRLLKGIGEISEEYNLYTQTCATNERYER